MGCFYLSPKDSLPLVKPGFGLKRRERNVLAWAAGTVGRTRLISLMPLVRLG